jgi:hypothetical protein
VDGAAVEQVAMRRKSFEVPVDRSLKVTSSEDAAPQAHLGQAAKKFWR